MDAFMSFRLWTVGGTRDNIENSRIVFVERNIQEHREADKWIRQRSFGS